MSIDHSENDHDQKPPIRGRVNAADKGACKRRREVTANDGG